MPISSPAAYPAYLPGVPPSYGPYGYGPGQTGNVPPSAWAAQQLPLTDDTSSSSSPDTIAIALGTVGGALVLLGGAGITAYVLNRKKENKAGGKTGKDGGRAAGLAPQQLRGGEAEHSPADKTPVPAGTAQTPQPPTDPKAAAQTQAPAPLPLNKPLPPLPPAGDEAQQKMAARIEQNIKRYTTLQDFMQRMSSAVKDGGAPTKLRRGSKLKAWSSLSAEEKGARKLAGGLFKDIKKSVKIQRKAWKQELASLPATEIDERAELRRLRDLGKRIYGNPAGDPRLASEIEQQLGHWRRAQNPHASGAGRAFLHSA